MERRKNEVEKWHLLNVDDPKRVCVCVPNRLSLPFVVHRNCHFATSKCLCLCPLWRSRTRRNENADQRCCCRHRRRCAFPVPIHRIAFLVAVDGRFECCQSFAQFKLCVDAGFSSSLSPFRSKFQFQSLHHPFRSHNCSSASKISFICLLNSHRKMARLLLPNSNHLLLRTFWHQNWCLTRHRHCHRRVEQWLKSTKR